MLSLILLGFFISGTIIGGMTIHGLTDKGYGDNSRSSLDRLIEAWKEDRQAQREHEKSKLKFLDRHYEE